MGLNPSDIPAQYFSLIDAVDREDCYNLRDSTAEQQILSSSREDQRLFVLAIIAWLENSGHPPGTTKKEKLARQILHDKENILASRFYMVQQTMFEMLWRKLPFISDDILVLLNWFVNQYPYHFRVDYLIKVLEYFLKEHPLTSEMQDKIASIVKKTENYHGNEEVAQAAQLRGLAKLDNGFALVEGEAWSDAVIADLEAAHAQVSSAWKALLKICRKANKAKPNKSWLKEARSALTQIGHKEFRQNIQRWFPLVDRPRTNLIESYPDWTPDPNPMINTANANSLRGLAWLCAEQEDKDVARALKILALSAYRKVPMVGPRCVKLGNACVWALGQMPGLTSVAELALLKNKVKFATAQKGIEKALTLAAEREGIDREEIEELVIPTFGMESVGLRREEFGDFTAELRITGTNTTELRWLKTSGKAQKSVPKVVRENDAEQLAELRKAAKDIKTIIPVQRDRIDNFYLQQKEWDYPTWQKRYLNHPLVGTLARRLIWQFTDSTRTESGIWLHDTIVNHDDAPVDLLNDTVPEKVKVRLWHPIDQPVEQVLMWRDWLTSHAVQQPFKQAHREVYLLTDAERQTEVYSNRFAAHILRQHQFNALCSARGWQNKLRLFVDDEYPPASKILANWGLRAEFWVEGAGDDINDSGTFLYLATDQVRFYPDDAPENSAHADGGGYGTAYGWGYGWGDPGVPLQLDQVPPLVLSEIMRDVDLFVGVASIANDPSWMDGGREAAHTTYWQDYSFGELSETAKTRRLALERLIPLLKIANQCTLNDKFLIVQGQLRTYKIHLGSSNILMLPNDQYLCIVAAQGTATKNAAKKVFLPFEGDNTLSLILSKAFLLATDDTIKDTTILQQIKA